PRLPRDGAGGGVEPGRLRPQGPRHLLHGRAIVRAEERREGARDTQGQPQNGRRRLLQTIVAPRRVVLDATAARRAAAGLLSRRAWTRREPALRSPDPVRTAARLRGFLMRRGYPEAIVARVLRESTGLSGED